MLGPPGRKRRVSTQRKGGKHCDVPSGINGSPRSGKCLMWGDSEMGERGEGMGQLEGTGTIQVILM